MTEIANSNPPLVNPSDSYSPLRRAFRNFVHWASYHFILSSKRTRQVAIGDLKLTVPPTVFHPGIFLTSRIFAQYLRCADLRGKAVVEVGTGSGVLALSAARAGASRVLALDINPAAAGAAAQNALANGLAGTVEARTSDLLSAVRKDELFDLIISSPPSFGGEPRDIADRAWHAGVGYGDIRPLFRQACEHLNESGEMLLLLSSDTNLPLIESLARQAGFDWTLVARKSILIESFLIFRLTKGANVAAAASRLPGRAELEAAYLRREANQDVAVLEALALAKAVLDSSPERDGLRHTLSGIEAQIDARTSPVMRDGYMAQAKNRVEQLKAAEPGRRHSSS